MVNTSRSHGYGWNDLAQHPAEGLHEGDVFVQPEAFATYWTRSDGSVSGGWDGPQGTAWTVTACDGDRMEARGHDGRVQETTSLSGTVLRVLSKLSSAEAWARRKLVRDAVQFLESADKASVTAALAQVPGLNSNLDATTVVAHLSGTDPADGALGRMVWTVAQQIVDAASPAPARPTGGATR